ncbi:MAG: DNA cytosine methyltransferase [Candidatus Thiodiazotropha lotti]|nr:DNA cytosine methyltransferase [Candidatus Thiodiazotropha lotti]
MGRDKNKEFIPVVDLFAGPGGLSEGFSAYRNGSYFQTTLSVEKDDWAHKTLELRSFVRQFTKGRIPKRYYEYIRGEGITRRELFEAFPEKHATAENIAWHAELGKEPLATVIDRVSEAIGDSDHWVLLGGPPCQAYSTIGRARRTNDIHFEKDHKHTLYHEYLKIVAALRPTVFVMENVKGILSASLNGEKIFPKILSDLRDPIEALSEDDREGLPPLDLEHRYAVYSFVQEAVDEQFLKPEDYLIKSEDYGVPQNRHRVILLGIRGDHDCGPHPVLEPIDKPFTFHDVLANMRPLRSQMSKNDEGFVEWKTRVGKCLNNRQLKTKKFADVQDRMVKAVKRMRISSQYGGQFVPGDCNPAELSQWLYDPKIGGSIQHETRGHMDSDFWRYLFASSYAAVRDEVPKLEQFPKFLWPNHKNAKADENGRVRNFRDRFRVQVWDQPSTTVTAHLRKDGHYFIHPDPSQCRSITVREAARLQTFPDNYFFEGPRGKQYEQIGNAVPPYLAYHLADVISEILDGCKMAEQANDMDIEEILLSEDCA